MKKNVLLLHLFVALLIVAACNSEKVNGAATDADNNQELNAEPGPKNDKIKQTEVSATNLDKENEENKESPDKSNYWSQEAKVWGVAREKARNNNLSFQDYISCIPSATLPVSYKDYSSLMQITNPNDELLCYEYKINMEEAAKYPLILVAEDDPEYGSDSKRIEYEFESICKGLKLRPGDEVKATLDWQSNYKVIEGQIPDLNLLNGGERSCFRMPLFKIEQDGVVVIAYLTAFRWVDTSYPYITLCIYSNEGVLFTKADDHSGVNNNFLGAVAIDSYYRYGAEITKNGDLIVENYSVDEGAMDENYELNPDKYPLIEKRTEKYKLSSKGWIMSIH
jgi:hypothetical protein